MDRCVATCRPPSNRPHWVSPKFTVRTLTFLLGMGTDCCAVHLKQTGFCSVSPSSRVRRRSRSRSADRPDTSTTRESLDDSDDEEVGSLRLLTGLRFDPGTASVSQCATALAGYLLTCEGAGFSACAFITRPRVCCGFRSMLRVRIMRCFSLRSDVESVRKRLNKLRWKL